MRLPGEPVYLLPAMNDSSSNSLSALSVGQVLNADAISRRAYELWEQEGRPEGRDLHHWLRAEQQLMAEQNQTTTSAVAPQASASRAAAVDTKPLQSPQAVAKTATRRAAPSIPAKARAGR